MTVEILKEVGGSTVLPLSDAVLSELGLKADSRVVVRVDAGRILVEPIARPRYTLDNLMAQCDLSLPLSAEERDWLDSPRVGAEEI